VNEHRIRLRGGWECCATGTLRPIRERLSLPVRWSPHGPKRLRLTRHFGRPPLDPARQELVLDLDQVAGISSVVLNGQSVACVSPERSRFEIPLDGALERNTLVLEIETPEAAGEPAGMTPEWGFIALVIRPIEAETGSGSAPP
jgi:hypothetical protein